MPEIASWTIAWPDSEGCVVWSGELGLYDFERFTVLLGHHKDQELVRVTARHEYLHHHLVLSTPFGWLLRDARQRDAAGARRYRKLLAVLVRESRTVQEMVATYGSLNDCGRQELLADMPAPYREAYARCAAVVERTFPGRLARSKYAIALGRCMMMGRPTPTVVEELLAGEGTSLPVQLSPDRRFELASSLLLSLTPEAMVGRVRAWFSSDTARYLESDSETDFIAGVGDRGKGQQMLANFSESLMRGLCEVLQPALPGLEDQFRDYRMVQAARGKEGVDGHTGADMLESIRHSADHRVAFMSAPPEPVAIERHEPSRFLAVTHASLRRPGALYSRIQCAPSGRPAAFVTAVEQAGTLRLIYCRVGEGELIALRHWTGPRITLLATSDLAGLRSQALSSALTSHLATNAYVYVQGNPVEFAVALLRVGASIKWNVADLEYTDDAIQREHGLQLSLYAVVGDPLTYFHLSNFPLSGAIHALAEHVADPARMEVLTENSWAATFDARDIRWLIDHPLVVTALIYGQPMPVLEVGR